MLCTQIVLVLTFRTTYVHNMFYSCSHNVLPMFLAWNFHVLNWYFNNQSDVLLWVSWCKIRASDKDLPVHVVVQNILDSTKSLFLWKVLVSIFNRDTIFCVLIGRIFTIVHKLRWSWASLQNVAALFQNRPAEWVEISFECIGLKLHKCKYIIR